MPYCSLTETEIIEQLRANFYAQKDLRAQKEYKYFYDALPTWDERSIVSSRDKLVQTAVFSFKARIYGHGETKQGKKKDAVLEQAVEFTVQVCNDKFFLKIRGGDYYYCEQAGADIVEGAYAENVCEAAARNIYAQKLAEKGYIYERCELEDWDYVDRGMETYTEYEIEYDCYGEKKLIQAVISGENFIYFTTPVPKKKSHWGIVLGVILAVVVVAVAVVLVVVLTKK